MKHFFFWILLLTALQTSAREWHTLNGKTIEAEIVWVNEDREVKLKTAEGHTGIAPFSSFTDEDRTVLENLLFRKLHGEPHPVPWTEMNQLFGLSIWNDIFLWDDPTSAAAERMQLQKESKTEFMENHRAYPLGTASVLGEPVYTTVLYGGATHCDSLCFVFLNQGDIPAPDSITDDFIEKITDDIEASGQHVLDAITPVLGDPERDTIGKGELREKVSRWDWNGHAILLTTREGSYTMLHIIPTSIADRSGRAGKIKGTELRERMKACKTTRSNGDVIIKNIPMIDQGPKGYCAPATWERYMRYLGIPANMYQLANIGQTSIGGGTYISSMINATEGILSTNGRRLEQIDDPLSIETAAEYIDQGMPLMWAFSSSTRFQNAVQQNTAKRNGLTYTPGPAADAAQDYSGHICLIVGYNEKTSEIAISDSWGPGFAERWVPTDQLRLVPNDELYFIKW